MRMLMIFFSLRCCSHRFPAFDACRKCARTAESSSKIMAVISATAAEAQGLGKDRGLGPKPIAFTAVQRYIRHPTGQMPPYTAKVVSDKDLADIYAFLQSVNNRLR